jgi:hypothetical protein
MLHEHCSSAPFVYIIAPWGEVGDNMYVLDVTFRRRLSELEFCHQITFNKGQHHHHLETKHAYSQ